MENKKIKVNTDVMNVLKAKDYEYLLKYANEGYDDEIDFICDFLKLDQEIVLDIPRRQLLMLVRDIIDSINTFNERYTKAQHEPIKQEIIVGKQKYVLITDYLSQPVGWWHHINSIDHKDDPLLKLGLMYMEEGMDYATIDKHGNILNPTSERIEKLSNHLTLAEFIEVNGFFLRLCHVLNLIYLERTQEAMKN
jgi:hypothetical protein